MSVNCAVTQVTSETNQIRRFLNDRQFEKLETIMTQVHYKEGSRLFWEDEPADKLFYIAKGHVKVTKMTDEGREMILYFLQEGDMFGEIGGLSEVNFSFSGEALVDSVVEVITLTDLEQMISGDGEFAVQFIKWMGVLQRTTESKFRDLLLFGKTGALASTLIRLCNSYGKMTEEGIEIELKLTNTDLANIIGTARESVNRLLKEYKDKGVMTIDHGKIIVHDLAYLREIVHCPNCPDEICRM
ncbi:Crp/Fnr family transcriptional regulator [Marinicrinis sediminis]|uniref:Crp/Fnr family transcriptional regulator n=1 Tax=Marinicrinis sediminis TaxID=1652465 RepID=A0ABW5R6A3_9BACL